MPVWMKLRCQDRLCEFLGFSRDSFSHSLSCLIFIILHKLYSYITKDGGIDYEIVLLAVYHILKRETNITSLRLIETGLNICELLIDFGVLKLGEHAHKLAMGIIKRALLHLGCPHGCNDGVRGAQAEFLRLQCNSNLSRLMKQASSLSKKFLREMVRESSLHELIEFFHAFVGFCVDPSSLLSPLSKLLA